MTGGERAIKPRRKALNTERRVAACMWRVRLVLVVSNLRVCRQRRGLGFDGGWRHRRGAGAGGARPRALAAYPDGCD